MKFKFLIPVVACLGLSAVSMPLLSANEAAQTPADSEQWRKNPPKLPDPRSFNLPEIERYKLPNGLSVSLVEDHRVPWTTVSMGIKAGHISDSKDLPGLAAMVADMVTEGTKNRSSKQIAEDIDYIGGAISSSAGSDFTYVSASGLSQYNDRLFDILSDVLLNPSFPEDELKLKKTNKIQELTIQRGRPEFLVDERFAEVVFGDHPYAFISPKPQNVEKITREQLAAFHRRWYLPNETALVVVGDFKRPEMKALIAKTFGTWKSGKPEEPQLGDYPQQKGRMIHLVDRKDSVQSAVQVGNLGIKRKDPDFYASQVANQILGGAAISRLFLNLREKNGYTYGAYSQAAARKHPGFFSAEANVRTEVTGKALQEFLFELGKIRDEKVTDSELAQAKAYMVGVFQLGLESQGGLAQRLLEGQLYELPPDYLEKFGDRVMAVSAEDVKRVANRIIDSDNLVICVVGDGSKIKADLEKIAPVTVYNTDGVVTQQPKGSTKATAGGS